MSREADERLTDAWLTCALGRGIGHEEHLRIGFVLLRRHDRPEALRVLDDGTRRNCAALGVPERYDAALTRRWGQTLADAAAATDAADADELFRRRPELLRSDLLGAPAWRDR
jgi:hypothetical protein